jgi:type IV secretory pathway VirB3-like protein
MLVLATVQLDNAAIPTSPTLLLVMMVACALKQILANLVNVLDQTPLYALLSINVMILAYAMVQQDNALNR